MSGSLAGALHRLGDLESRLELLMPLVVGLGEPLALPCIEGQPGLVSLPLAEPLVVALPPPAVPALPIRALCDLCGGRCESVPEPLDRLAECFVLQVRDDDEVERRLTELLREHVERALQLDRLVDERLAVTLVAAALDGVPLLRERVSLPLEPFQAQTTERDVPDRFLAELSGEFVDLRAMLEDLGTELTPNIALLGLAALDTCLDGLLEPLDRSLDGAVAVLAGVQPGRHDHSVRELPRKRPPTLDVERREELGLGDAERLRELGTDDRIGTIRSVLALDEGEDRGKPHKDVLTLGH